MESQLQQFDTTSHWYPVACQLRNLTLRLPLGLDLFNEDLSQETSYWHFALTTETEMAAYVMIIPDNIRCVTLRQMCVAPQHQKTGCGRTLIQLVETALLCQGVKGIQMSARESAIGFYEKLGYRTVGNQYLSLGIPHISMEKSLIDRSDDDVEDEIQLA